MVGGWEGGSGQATWHWDRCLKVLLEAFEGWRLPGTVPGLETRIGICRLGIMFLQTSRGWYRMKMDQTGRKNFQLAQDIAPSLQRSLLPLAQWVDRS